jgi:hypothetical protein
MDKHSLFDGWGNWITRGWNPLVSQMVEGITEKEGKENGA